MKHSILKVMAILIAVLLTAAVVPTAALAAAATNGTAVPSDNYVVIRRAPKVILPAPGASILIVTDAETGLPIEGAKYDLYRDNPFNGKDSKVGPTYKTNKDGKITVSHTWTGNFYWVAAGEVEGYAADEAKHEFKIVGLRFVTTEVKLGKPAPAAEEPAEEEPAIAERPVDEEIAEEPAEAAAPAIVGGWTVPEDTAITEEVKTVVDAALEKLLGVDYTPVALVGTQVVAGTNYCVLCEAAAVVPDAVPYYVLVYIYEALDGTVELLTITPLEEGDVIVAEDGTVTLDPVVEIGLPAVEAEEAPADAAATVTVEETTIG